MIFVGVSRVFSLENEDQYNTIGAFWDEISTVYGLENLRGLGYKWKNGQIYYAIGLKQGEIDHSNFKIVLPDENWRIVFGKTDNLKQIYDVIYLEGVLTYEIECFYENGDCEIRYYRNEN